MGNPDAFPLSGRDLEHCEALFEELCEKNCKNRNASNGSPVIAIGMATFEPDDVDLAAVFTRADAAMYENKRCLKCADQTNDKHHRTT